jgi:hypothetical protein
MAFIARQPVTGQPFAVVLDAIMITLTQAKLRQETVD